IGANRPCHTGEGVKDSARSRVSGVSRQRRRHTERWGVMGAVELHQAWHWACDECGRDNFARSVTADLSGLTEEEIRGYALQLGIIDVHETEIPEGSFVTIPTT